MDNIVDLVFISYVLHQSEKKQMFISEAYRVLKKNGYIIIISSSHDQLRKDLVHQYFPGILEINLKRFPSLDEIRRMLIKVGFKKVVSSEISVKQGYPIEKMINIVKEKYISVLKLLSEKKFQTGLESFMKTLKSKYKDKVIYKDSSSFIMAIKLV